MSQAPETVDVVVVGAGGGVVRIVAAGEVRGVRAAGSVTADVAAPLPAVVSVTERTPEARFPNFRGIMRARKKPTQTLTLADLPGVGTDIVALAAADTFVANLRAQALTPAEPAN